MQKNTLQIIKIISLILLFPATNFSQTEPYPPNTIENQPYAYCTTCSGSKWMNTGQVVVTDNQFSTVTLKPHLYCYQDQCYWSRYLDCHNFGFSIPSDASIKGIQLDITGYCSANSAAKDYEILLRRNNMPAGTNMAAPGFWPSETATTTYGGGSELWGLAWTPLHIDSSNFGVFIKVKNISPNSPTVFIDAISMTITYELATGIYQQTSTISPLTVYNNASSEEVIVNFEMQKENKATELNLYDIQGKKCFSGVMSGQPGTITQKKINTGELKSGIYFVNIFSGNKLYSTKFNLVK